MGKRVDPASLQPGGRVAYDIRRQRADRILATAAKTYPRLPPVYFDFTDYPHLGAWSFGDHQQFHIAYSMGAEFILMLAFNRLLSDSLVLTEIGKADAEEPGLDKLAPLIQEVPSMIDFVGVLKAMPLPKCEDRHKFAFWLRRAVSDFIVFHELAHLLAGHIAYRDSHFRYSLLKVRGRPSSPDEQNLVAQAFEKQADELAIFNCLTILKAEAAAFRADAEIGHYFQRPQSPLHYWVFGVCVFCRLFGDSTLAASSLDEQEHPPWRFRQRNILERVYSLCKDGQLFAGAFGSIDEVQDAIEGGLNHAEAAMSHIADRQREHDGLLEENSAYRDRLTRLLWEDLMPVLRPYWNS